MRQTIDKAILQNKAILQVAKAARELGLPTYIVGGFVRDHLLERGEKKDIDFVCVGSGIALATRVGELTGRTPAS